MNDDDLEINNNYGIFSSETELIIQGLGCEKIAPFKQRNLSTLDLKHLTEEDLKVLEAHFDEETYSVWKTKKRSKEGVDFFKAALEHIMAVLGSQKAQLLHMELFTKYLGLKSKDIKENHHIMHKSLDLTLAEVVEKASQANVDMLNKMMSEMAALEKVL